MKLVPELNQQQLLIYKQLTVVARFVTPIPNSIMFPRLDPESTSVKMFADASYNKLPNSGSQGGNIVFLSDKTNKSCAKAGIQEDLQKASSRNIIHTLDVKCK